jgi:intracellular multiplication protein IcmL
MFSKLLRTLKRPEFYRDSYRQLMWLTLLSLLGNIILMVAVVMFAGGHGRWFFYASTRDGQLLPLQQSRSPNLSDMAVLSWVNRVVPQIYTMNFLNYRQVLMEKEKYFTIPGWGSFLRSFGPTIAQVQQGQYDVHAAPSDVPIVTEKGVFQGKNMWQVQIPLIISYQHGAQEATQSVVWTVLLQQQDNTQSDQLLAITQVVQAYQNTQSN